MSATHVHALQEMVYFVVGGVNDAPGFKIVGDGHGGLKVVPVPGWNPEASVELGAALAVLANAGRIKNADASKAILQAASTIVSTELAKLGGAEKGATTVVIAGA